ncbi:MAG: hypothetical protein ACUZ9M_00595 [Candidatus Scalindua sp.]
MATKTNIANWAMIRVGEAIFDDIDNPVGDNATATADKFNAIYTISLEDILDGGPEKGWRFSNRRFHGIDRDKVTIVSIADSSTSGDITITGTHTLIVGDRVILDDDTGYGGDYVVTAISTTTTFDVTADFVASGTGIANWTSEVFAYRFSRPTSIRVTEVSVGGIELPDWTREGSWIVTNLESTEVDMKYIAAESDLSVANFPPHFVAAFRLKLASDLAYDIVQNSALGDRLLQEYEVIVLPRSIGLDNREIRVQESSNSWEAAGHTTTNIE